MHHVKAAHRFPVASVHVRSFYGEALLPARSAIDAPAGAAAPCA
jgi:hypothetical protein